MRFLEKLWYICQGTGNASAEDSTNNILTLANAVTSAGIVAIISIPPAMSTGHTAIAAMLAIVGVLSDVLDGHIARVTSTFSRVGKVLDWGRDALLRMATLAVIITMLPNYWIIITSFAMALAEAWMISVEARYINEGHMLRDQHERLPGMRIEIQGHTWVVVRQTALGLALIALILMPDWRTAMATAALTIAALNAALFALECRQKG